MATAGLLAAVEVAGRAVRDGFFLSELPVRSLPFAMAASALLSVAGTLALSSWLRRRPPDRVAPLLLSGSALGFVLLAVLATWQPRSAAALLYLHMTGLVPVFASTFWSISNERFDPYTAKTVIARMAAAGAAGGLAGGVAAERATVLLGMPAVLLALGGISALCALGAGRLSPHRPSSARAGAPPEDSSLRAAARRPLLRQMALLMFAAAVVETLVDYALKAEAAAVFDSRADLVRFFAAFYVGCGLLALLIQLAVRDRLLRRFGLASAVAMLPLGVAIAGAVGTWVARFWAFVVVRGVENVASIAFFRGGFQLLYTPLPAAVRRPAKAWVDVVAGSAGDLAGAALIFSLLAAMPDLRSALLLAVATVGAVGGVLIVSRIHRSYVGGLEDSLRLGQLALRSEQALDATTAHTIARSHVALDRASLLAQAREFHARRSSEVSEGRPAVPVAEVEVGQLAGGAGSELDWIQALSSGDAQRARRVLELETRAASGVSDEARRRIVPWVIPLLASDGVAPAAHAFLRDCGSRIIGQLVDALLDDTTPWRVRARLAGVLGGMQDARAMFGVWHAAADPHFEVRFACARAAARIASRDRRLAPARADVHARIRAELEVEERIWADQGERPPAAPAERSALLASRALAGVSRSIEHVLTLAAIAHGRREMAATLAGLTGTDPRLRGTALEYLESVLPADQSRMLFARLHAGVTPPTRRSQQEIEDQLLLSAADVLADVDSSGGSR